MKWEPETLENITDYKERREQKIIYLKYITNHINNHRNIFTPVVLAYLKHKLSLYAYNLYLIEPL